VWGWVAIHPHGLLLSVKVGHSRDIRTHRAPGEPGLVMWHVVADLAALSPQRPCSDLLHEEEKQLVLGDRVAIAVLLLLIK
jgi:hypothetical protein